MCLQALENLQVVSIQFRHAVDVLTNLELNLGLSDVLLATVAAGNLLCLLDLAPDGL